MPLVELLWLKASKRFTMHHDCYLLKFFFESTRLGRELVFAVKRMQQLLLEAPAELLSFVQLVTNLRQLELRDLTPVIRSMKVDRLETNIRTRDTQYRNKYILTWTKHCWQTDHYPLFLHVVEVLPLVNWQWKACWPLTEQITLAR